MPLSLLFSSNGKRCIINIIIGTAIDPFNWMSNETKFFFLFLLFVCYYRNTSHINWYRMQSKHLILTLVMKKKTLAFSSRNLKSSTFSSNLRSGFVKKWFLSRKQLNRCELRTSTLRNILIGTIYIFHQILNYLISLFILMNLIVGQLIRNDYYWKMKKFTKIIIKKQPKTIKELLNFNND